MTVTHRKRLIYREWISGYQWGEGMEEEQDTGRRRGGTNYYA